MIDTYADVTECYEHDYDATSWHKQWFNSRNIACACSDAIEDDSRICQISNYFYNLYITPVKFKESLLTSL